MIDYCRDRCGAYHSRMCCMSPVAATLAAAAVRRDGDRDRCRAGRARRFRSAPPRTSSPAHSVSCGQERRRVRETVPSVLATGPWVPETGRQWIRTDARHFPGRRMSAVRTFSAAAAAMWPTVLRSCYSVGSASQSRHRIDLCDGSWAATWAVRPSVVVEWSACLRSPRMWTRQRRPTPFDFAYCTIYSLQLWPYSVEHSIAATIDNCSNWPPTTVAVRCD